MQGPFRSINPSGQLNTRAVKRNAEYLGSLFALDAPAGYTFDQSATGTSLVDQRPQRRLAIVQDVYGSGSGASGSRPDGLGESPLSVTADMQSAYYVKFAQWVIEDNTYIAREMPEQPNVLAIEANGVENVPDGAIVEVLPGPGQPDFYYFWWTGELGSGSGNSIPAYCDGELSGYITIDGDSVSFESI